MRLWNSTIADLLRSRRAEAWTAAEIVQETRLSFSCVRANLNLMLQHGVVCRTLADGLNGHAISRWSWSVDERPVRVVDLFACGICGRDDDTQYEEGSDGVVRCPNCLRSSSTGIDNLDMGTIKRGMRFWESEGGRDVEFEALDDAIEENDVVTLRARELETGKEHELMMLRSAPAYAPRLYVRPQYRMS